MATEAPKPLPDLYRHQTLRPLNSLVFILPMLLAFQAGAAVFGTTLLAPRHMQGVLDYFGATAAHLPAVVIVFVLLVQHMLHKDPWRPEPKALAGMFAESIVWMIPLIAMIHLTGRLQAGESYPQARRITQEVLQAFGAGIYEEFIFRLGFVSLVLLIFVDVFGLKKEAFTIVAIIVGAAAFSLYHLPAEQFPSLPPGAWPKLIFRTVAGIYLGALFVYRGFGIAVGTHAFYNIYALVAELR